MSWNKDKQIHLISTEGDLFDALSYLSDQKLLALDTETTGLRRDRSVIGIALANSEDQAFYIPLQYWSGVSNKLVPFWPNQESIYNCIRDFLMEPRQYIMHNAQFDIGSIENELGVTLLNRIHCDTQLLAHTVYREEPPLGLKSLATELLDPDAANPQDDVKEDVKAKGGKITKTNFEMYKCDYVILGKYAAYDVLYTFGLYNKLYPEIAKQGLEELWNGEVMALLPVMYDLNHNGIKINIPYFEELKLQMQDKIQAIEDELYIQIKDKIYSYEIQKAKDEIKIGKQSAFGKYLLNENKASFDKETKTLNILTNINEDLYKFYCNKKETKYIFNLDSNNDKAFLVYDVLGFKCSEMTESGKRSVDSDNLSKLDSPVVSLILQRAAEQKLLNTYVIPLLDSHIDGIIYTGFRQTGTISGRLSSGEPINLQTLPRDDRRIKAGFVPREDCVFIGDDYSSLEPRIFSEVSQEAKLIEAFNAGEDFYSRIAIDVFGLTGVSAREEDTNFLKKVNPEYRQQVKTMALAIPYGAESGRISGLLNIKYEDARDLIAKYLNRYPNLKRWMTKTDIQVKTTGEVSTLSGRKRRLGLPKIIHTKYGINPYDKRDVLSLFYNKVEVEGFTDPIKLYLACKNARNNGRNFQIQGLAGSTMNAACIDFYNKAKLLNLSTKIILQIHDEIILEGPKKEAEVAAALVQDCMENNKITKTLKVKMQAVPVITDKSLAEAK